MVKGKRPVWWPHLIHRKRSSHRGNAAGVIRDLAENSHASFGKIADKTQNAHFRDDTIGP